MVHEKVQRSGIRSSRMVYVMQNEVAGTLTRNEVWDDWWHADTPLAVPFFGNEPLPVLFMEMYANSATE